MRRARTKGLNRGRRHLEWGETEQELRVAVAGAQLGGKEPGGLGERERRALRGKTLLVRKFRLGV